MQIFQEGVEKVMNDIKLREFLKQLADATESLQSSENTKILEKVIVKILLKIKEMICLNLK